MKVKLCEGTRLAGPIGNFGAGDVVDVIEAAGMAMIANGLAVAVDPPRETAARPETATLPAAERATLPTPRRRKSKKVEAP